MYTFEALNYFQENSYVLAIYMWWFGRLYVVWLFLCFVFPTLFLVFRSIFPINNYCCCNLAAILTSGSGSASQHSHMQALRIILQANLVKQYASWLRREQVFLHRISSSKGNKMRTTSFLFPLICKFHSLTEILFVLLFWAEEIRCTLIGHTALFIY